MKKLAVVLACLDIIIISMLVLGYPQKWFIKKAEPEPPSSNSYYNTSASASQETSEAYAMTSKAPYYTVKAYNGHIGIFLNDSQSLYGEIEVDVESLPEEDQQLLKSTGIKVSDTESLQKLIEDYES